MTIVLIFILALTIAFSAIAMYLFFTTTKNPLVLFSPRINGMFSSLLSVETILIGDFFCSLAMIRSYFLLRARFLYDLTRIHRLEPIENEIHIMSNLSNIIKPDSNRFIIKV